MMGTATIEHIRSWVLPAPAKAVLLALAHFHNDENHRCHPSMETLAETTGLHRATVIRAVACLRDAGAVVVSVGFRGSYQYTIPESMSGRSVRRVAACDGSQGATGTGRSVLPVPVAACDLNTNRTPREHQESAASDSQDHIGPLFTTKTGKPWSLTPDDHRKLIAAHPDMDVDSELAKAVLWCEANPSRRKTGKGMLRFLAGWLGRASPSEPAPAQMRRLDVPDPDDDVVDIGLVPALGRMP